MISTWYPAPDALSGVLAGIWSVQAEDDADVSARVLPDGSTCVVFQRDGTVLRSRDVRGRWAKTSVSGPRTGPFDFTLDAGGGILIAQLRAAGAVHALAVAMSSLTDRYESLDAVLGSVPQRLMDQVLGDDDDLMCVRAVERWLLTRLRRQHATCDVTDTVVREVVLRAGGVRVEELADGVSLSRRHLARIMNERVGIPPKLFARIARFDHAVQLGRMSHMVPWAQVALKAGYADQAHMTREFAQLGGVRPTDLRGPAATWIW